MLKKQIRVVKLLFITLFICLLFSCGKDYFSRKVASITLSETQELTLIVSPIATDQSISFNSAKDYIVSVSKDATSWCLLSKAEGGAGDVQIVLTILANEETINRVAIITIKSDEVEKEIKLTQTRSAGVGRTILLYMAADNNLATNAINNLKDLANGYVPEEDAEDVLLVYKDINIEDERMNPYTNGKNPRLYRYYTDEEGEVVFDIVEEYESQNSASAEVFESILKRSIELFKNNSYGLILWSHATGWLPHNDVSKVQNRLSSVDPYAHLVKSFGADYSNNEEINIDILADILPEKYDFIIFDCCFMGCIEIAYELRDKCNYMIAAPTEILSAGFPYNDIFAELYNAKPNYASVCKTFFTDHNSAGYGGTISLYKTAEIYKLAQAVKEIVKANRDKMSSIRLSDMQPYFRPSNALSFGYFYDLGAYMEEIASEEQFVKFKKALDEVVVFRDATSRFIDLNIDLGKTFGVSSYIQKTEATDINKYYSTLDWNKDTETILLD